MARPVANHMQMSKPKKRRLKPAMREVRMRFQRTCRPGAI